MLEQDSEFSEKYRYSDKLLKLIKKAIENDELSPSYQPLLHIPLPDQHTSFIAQLELPLSSGQIIPYRGVRQLAKMSDLLALLDQQMMVKAAIPALKDLHQHQQADARIFVSQSSSALQDPNYLDWLEQQFNIGTTLSPQGLVIAFRLNDIAKDVKGAKKKISALHEFGVETMIEGFNHNPIAGKLLFAMESAYVNISTTEYNSSDTLVDTIIHQCKRRKAKILLAQIDDGTTINLQWSAGVDFIGGPYVQPALPDTHYVFPASIV